MAMFKKNDIVMYGATGVCRVVDIGTPEFAQEAERLYYFLEPIYQNGLIYAPIDNETVSIRYVISRSEANELIESIDGIQVEHFGGQSMQQVSQKYQQILDKHDCRELLMLTKSIHAKALESLKQNKRLGQIDKRFKKKAEELLFGEFSIALDMEKDEVERYIYDRLTVSLSM